VAWLSLSSGITSAATAATWCWNIASGRDRSRSFRIFESIACSVILPTAGRSADAARCRIAKRVVLLDLPDNKPRSESGDQHTSHPSEDESGPEIAHTFLRRLTKTMSKNPRDAASDLGLGDLSRLPATNRRPSSMTTGISSLTTAANSTV
jgi:hypothetical protein